MEIGCTSEELTTFKDRIVMMDAQRLAQLRRHRHYNHLCEVIDTMGTLSKESQGINAVLTSAARLKDVPTHRLYILFDKSRCVGIIKVGVKKLFIRNKVGALSEIDPLCVLDFFVFTTEQRSGYGKELYEHMLQAEGVRPEQLGIDRPSPKFLGFMKKHYGLVDYVPQTNNFVVFNQYFEKNGTNGSGKGPLGRQSLPNGFEVTNPYSRNYAGGFNSTASANTAAASSSSGGTSGRTLTIDQAKHAITTGLGRPHQLPPIGGDDSHAAGRPRQPSVEPQPLSSQPPKPTPTHSGNGGPSPLPLAGGGGGGQGSRSSIGIGMGGGGGIIGGRRAQSPTMSAVDYNILNPSAGNSRSGSGVGLGLGSSTASNSSLMNSRGLRGRF